MKKFFAKWSIVLMLVFGLALAGPVVALTGDRPNPSGVENLSSNLYVNIVEDRAIVLYDSVASTQDAFYLEQLVIKHNIKFVDLYLANGGGNVFLMMDFLDMMDRLQRSGVYFTGYARALVASAAVPVFVMCDTRVMAPHAWIMMHPGSWHSTSRYAPIPSCYNKLFLEIETVYARIVSDHSKMTFWEVMVILSGADSEENQVWFTAEEALARGLCDRVEPFTYHSVMPVPPPVVPNESGF